MSQEGSGVNGERVCRGYTISVGVEVSGKAGGVHLSHVEVLPRWVERAVRQTMGAGVVPAVHRNVHPLVYAGPTLEYYTKLSHFSVGIDADVSYALGFDLGVAGTGYLKYTF